MKGRTLGKRTLALVLSVCLAFSTFVMTSVQAAEEEPKTREITLSQLDWVSATHGDETKTYTVQKDQTFSYGNGMSTKPEDKNLRLMLEGTETAFETGISATAPSRIEWDITGKSYVRLTGYVGVDRNQLGSWNGSTDGAREALVKKVTIYADDTKIWESRENFNPTEDAQRVDVAIPEGTKKLVFDADAGVDGQEGQSQKAAWGDEVDFADAKLLQQLPDPENLALNKTVTAQNTDGTAVRVNNDRPLSMAVDGTIPPNDASPNYADFGDENGATAKSCYLQVDLGEVYLLDHLYMWRYFNDNRTYKNTVIQLSKTVDFSDPITVYNADAANVHGLGAGTDAEYAETKAGRSFAVPEGTEARYVRIYAYGNSTGKTNHIVELQVWGWNFGPKPYEADAFQNADNYLTSFDVICPDYQLDADLEHQSDKEKAAKGQVTHPDVIMLPEEARARFGGHIYWMGYTPNGGVGNSYNENPCVAVSDDGINWELPAEDIPNPLVMRRDTPVGASNRVHNCDTDLFYDAQNNRLILYWEWTNDNNDPAFQRGSAVQYLVSYNGTDWGVPVDYAPEKALNSGKPRKTFDGVEMILTGGDDDVYGEAVISHDSRYSDLSPTVTYDSDRELYLMWANDAGDAGYNNKNCKVWMRWSKDPLKGWSDKIYVNNFLGKNEQGQQMVPWHQDIQYIPELHEFWALAQAWPQPGSTDNTSLRFTKSKDGVNWEPVSTKMLLKPSASGWDNFQIYRSTFHIAFDEAHPGDLNYAKFQIWYGALGVPAPALLAGQNWHIGYTENDYIEVMKSQTQDEYYEIPALVDATAMSLTTPDREIDVAETTKVTAAFTPGDAYGQLVKFTSETPDVATVDPFGNVTGLKKGVAEIKAVSDLWNKTATIKIYVGGEKPNMRIEVSNEHPMLMVPLYGTKPSKYPQSAWDFQALDWGDTVEGRWEAIPEDLRDNVVFEIHPSGAVGLQNVPGRGEAQTKAFFEDKLERCQALGIKTVLVVATAGQQGIYTGTYNMGNSEEWLRSMFEKYDCLVGLMSTENYWTSYNRVANESLMYARVCADYGSYFIWSEQKTGVLENIFTNDSFNQMVSEYSDHFIMTFKNTPASDGQNAGSNSMMQGAWLTGQMAQWGGLMDTWKWWEKKEWKLFAESSLPGGGNGGEEARCTASEPEALLMSEMMNIYLNGGCVYNFEIPAYVYGSNDEVSPAFAYSVAEFMRYAIQNPAPSKQEIAEQTKVVFHNQAGKRFSSINGSFYQGLNCEDQTQPTYTTGRYGLIPVIQETVSEAVIQANLPNAEIITKDSACLASKDAKVAYFNEKYPQQYTGDAFGMVQGGKFYVYNSWENKDIDQSATYENPDGTAIRFDIEPHTNIIYDPAAKNIYLNNYRVDKDPIWENYTAGTLRWNTDNNDLLEQYMVGYSANPLDDTLRATTITLTGIDAKPVVTVNTANSLAKTGTTDAPQYLEPVVEYNAQTKTATITVQCNGYVDFTINQSEPTLDTADLERAITAGDQVLADIEAGKYQPAGQEEFKSALQAAKDILEKAAAGDPSVTQEAVNGALEALQTAQRNLRPAQTLNTQSLEDQITKGEQVLADIEAGKYLPVGQEEFKAALEKAKDTLEKANAGDPSVTQEDVKDAALNLHNARLSLRLVASREALQALLDEAKQIKLEEFTEESGRTLKAAIAQAELVLADGQATDAQIELAQDSLQAAIQGLVPKTDDPDTGDSSSGQPEEPPVSSEQPGGEDDDSKSETPSSQTQKDPAQTGDADILPILLAACTLSLGLLAMLAKRGRVRR